MKNWFRKWFKTQETLVPEVIVENKVETNIVKSMWRNNMWVMSPKGIGVLFKLDNPCVVHLVDKEGLTTSEIQLPVEQLRQAMWDEIPEKRRGISREKGKRLGYN